MTPIKGLFGRKRKKPESRKRAVKGTPIGPQPGTAPATNYKQQQYQQETPQKKEVIGKVTPKRPENYFLHIIEMLHSRGKVEVHYNGSPLPPEGLNIMAREIVDISERIKKESQCFQPNYDPLSNQIKDLEDRVEVLNDEIPLKWRSILDKGVKELYSRLIENSLDYEHEEV